MNRGDVFFGPFPFGDPERFGELDPNVREKFMIVLQTDPSDQPPSRDVTVVLGSTFRLPRELALYETLVRPTPNGFSSDTLIDASRPYTLPRPWIGRNFRFRLTTTTMDDVDLSLMVGLQMRFRKPS